MKAKERKLLVGVVLAEGDDCLSEQVPEHLKIEIAIWLGQPWRTPALSHQSKSLRSSEFPAQKYLSNIEGEIPVLVRPPNCTSPCRQ